MAKLTRFLVSQEWEAHFPKSICNGKARIISDHILICLDTLPPSWGPFPFKFYKSWLFKEVFEAFINNTIVSISRESNAISSFAAKLKKIKMAIKGWLPFRRIDHQARLTEIENLVQGFDIMAESGTLSQDDLARKHSLRVEHFNILRELEVYWKQRSRIQWLKEGDLNTVFFHKMVNFRRRINNISSLNIEGVHIDSPMIISLAIENFFKSLYNKPTCQGVSLNWNYLLPDKILDSTKLVAPFSEEEIKNGVDSLPGEKSPGSNGFLLCFYHRF